MLSCLHAHDLSHTRPFTSSRLKTTHEHSSAALPAHEDVRRASVAWLQRDKHRVAPSDACPQHSNVVATGRNAAGGHCTTTAYSSHRQVARHGI